MMVSGLQNISRIPGEFAYIQPSGRTDPVEPVEAISGRHKGLRSIYPEEALDAIVDYSLNYTGEQVPPYQIRNIGQIMNDAVNPAITKMLDGTVDAQAAMDEAVENAAPLMQGRW